MNMQKAELILQLTKTKSRRVNLQLNKKLWDLFLQTTKKEKKTATEVIEEMILKRLVAKKLL